MATLVQPKLAVVLDLLSEKFDTGLAKSESRLGSFGKTAGKVGLLAAGGIAAAGVAIGGTLLKIGADYDSMQDTIRIGAGLTGKALDQMSQDAAAVFASIPTSWDKVGQAFTEVYRRTGDTGKALQDVTRSELELARITGADLATVLDTTTQLFGQWNVATDKQVATLDELFRASQASGIPIADLSQQLDQFGPILREMGLGLDDSVALLAGLNKVGIPAQQVMVGLRTAFKEFTKEGVTDTHAALKKLFADIGKAPTDLAAAQLGLKAFGARAGPALVDAIRSGRLNYDDLVKTIAGGHDTILGAARATNDWRENLKILTNSLQVLLLPAANAVFAGLNRIVLLITGPVMAAAKTLTRGIAEMTGWFDIFRQKGLDPVSAALRAFGTWLEHFQTGNKTLDTIVNDIGHAIAYVAQTLHDLLSGNPDKALAHIGDAFGFLWDAITTGFLAIPWATIGQAILDGLASVFQWVAANGMDLAQTLLTSLFGGGQGAGQAAAAFMINLIGAIAGWVVANPDVIGQALLGLFVVTAGVQAAIVALAGALVAGLVVGIADEIGKQWGPTIEPALEAQWANIQAWLLSLPGAAFFDTALTWGSSLISGFVAGIQSVWDTLTGRIQSILDELNKIPSWLRPGSPSQTMAVYGRSAAEGLALGIDQGMPALARSVGRMTDALGGVGTPRTAAAGAGAAAGAAAAGAAVGRGPIALTVNVNGANMTNDQVADAVSAAIMRRMRYIQAGA